MGSGLKTWASGDILTASDVNGFLMTQVVITCTSATRPSSPAEGWLIFETDTYTYRSWSVNVGAWVSVFMNRVVVYNPTLTAGTTNPTLGTGSVSVGWYSRLSGNMINFTFALKFGTSGVAAGSGQYKVSLPVAAQGVFGGGMPENMGSGVVRDNSTGTIAQATWYVPTTELTVLNGLVNNATLGDSAPWVWATTDYLAGTILYRAAS